MFNNENNYTEKETKKIIELSNRVFEHVGNQCGLRKLTYETYLGLPENDTRRKNVDNYFKKGFKNIKEMKFLNFKNRVETLYKYLSNKDILSFIDFDSFIELNEKITGKKAKEEPKVETNKTNINTNTSDIDDLFMEGENKTKSVEKGLFGKFKDAFIKGRERAKNNKVVEGVSKNSGEIKNFFSEIGDSKFGRFARKLKEPLQSLVWVLNFGSIIGFAVFWGIAMATGEGLLFVAGPLTVFSIVPVATLAYYGFKLVNKIIKKIKNKEINSKNTEKEASKVLEEELEQEKEKTEEKSKGLDELDLDAVEKDGVSQEATEEEVTKETLENEEEITHDEEFAENLNEEEKIQPTLETNDLSTPKQNDTAAILEIRKKIQILANNQERYERSLKFINSEIENIKSTVGLSHKELYNKNVNPTYVRRVNQRNVVNKMINECKKAISQCKEMINHESNIAGLTKGQHSNLEIEQMIAALNQIKEKQTAVASSVEKIEEYESRMR